MGLILMDTCTPFAKNVKAQNKRFSADQALCTTGFLVRLQTHLFETGRLTTRK
jgi:hypothetical protein